MDTVIKYDLRDTHTGDKTVIPCTVEFSNGVIYIRPEGYGDCGTEDGYGCPVLIEYYDGSLRVVVWDDINQEDPKVLKLDDARESNRLVDTN